MDSTLRLHYGNYQHVEPYWDGTAYYGMCWRLYYNLAPGGRIVTRHEQVDLTPDHLYLLPPRLSFSAHQKDNPKQFFLHFDAEEPYDRVQSGVYTLPIDSLLRDLLKRTLSEIRPQPFFLTDAGTMYAMALTAAALATIPKDKIQLKPMDPRVAEAIEYFREKVDKKASLDEAAHRIGMSKGAFIRLFKQETGRTPYTYLMEMRITWTCDLLAHDSMSIDLIAGHAGFTDRFHFSKVFRQWIGIPPAAYRRREQKK